LATALNAFPTWSEPVGLGAKRTLFIEAESRAVLTIWSRARRLDVLDALSYE